jgi:ABC-type uncharacterized transport system substrate-binding protein
MRPRWFTILLVLFAASGFAGEPSVVGIVASGTDPAAKLPRWERFYDRMRELGWRDGETIRFERRFAANDAKKLEAMLQEFVRAKVSLIVVSGTGEAVAAKRATGTIPIVVLHALDPVKLGLVQSLAHPGGNLTGRTQIVSGVSGKLLELIAQTLPSAKNVVYGRGATGSREHGEEIGVAAQSLALAYRQVDLPRDRNFDRWASRMKGEGMDAAVFVLDGFTFSAPHNANLAAALIRHKLPAICGASEYADAGCLMSYGPVTLDHYVRGAELVDKILRGARPADLPMEQPTRFELVVNQRTAKAIGIKIPQSMLLRADRVIE